MWAVTFDEKGATVSWDGGSFHRPKATVLENPEQYVPKKHLLGYSEIGIYRYYKQGGTPPVAQDGFNPTADPWVLMRTIEGCSGREARSVRVACCMRETLYCKILDKDITINDCYQCRHRVAEVDNDNH